MALDPNYADSARKAIGETMRQALIKSCLDMAKLAQESTWENMLEPATAAVPQAVVNHQGVVNNVVVGTWQKVQTQATTPDQVHQIFAGLTAQGVDFKI